ncbi:mechanosensitive ion channel protein MscS [Alicyclobacillus contaminans]|uniref:mechanosensitive ion channel family protein n=1 Tax=Alicyclobacillus contaminans TaxID=392016 RepID=UPI0004200601|nr:mechanosensitive ion channel family protein [Alicyclobacillus contaminans]GMA50761.1 mechanosensitive ion channel protein MscS [Alicyclobacillus contaminans]
MKSYLDWYSDSRNLPLVSAAGHILLLIVYFVLARIAIRISVSAVHRLMKSQLMRLDERRRMTLTSLLDNVVRYIIYFIFVVEVLTSLHVHVETLIAGAGIAGLAVGFGAQSLIKDMLTGLFILFEDQYGVGDCVKINQFTGTVESIGLRLTRIRAWTGEVEIIPNGQIQQVTNYSRHNSLAVMDIHVNRDVDLNRAMEVIANTMKQVRLEDDNMLRDAEILGVQAMEQNDIIIRVTAECQPMTHAAVQRLAYQRIKEAFDREGIETPLQRHVIRIESSAGPAAGPVPKTADGRQTGGVS